MKRSILHIKTFQRIALMLAVTVALTPCAVKETIFSSFDIAFERPLNKTRSVQGVNSVCESDVFSQTQIERNTEVAAILIPDVTVANFIILTGCKKVALKKYGKRTLGNSPPMYILYKRLKSDIA